MKKKIGTIQLLSDGPRGASDHKTDFKNENFRRFAIGAMLLVSLRVRLSQKLRLGKVRSVLECEGTLFFEAYYYNSTGSNQQ